MYLITFYVNDNKKEKINHFFEYCKTGYIRDRKIAINFQKFKPSMKHIGYTITFSKTCNIDFKELEKMTNTMSYLIDGTVLAKSTKLGHVDGLAFPDGPFSPFEEKIYCSYQGKQQYSFTIQPSEKVNLRGSHSRGDNECAENTGLVPSGETLRTHAMIERVTREFSGSAVTNPNSAGQRNLFSPDPDDGSARNGNGPFSLSSKECDYDLSTEVSPVPCSNRMKG